MVCLVHFVTKRRYVTVGGDGKDTLWHPTSDVSILNRVLSGFVSWFDLFLDDGRRTVDSFEYHRWGSFASHGDSDGRRYGT